MTAGTSTPAQSSSTNDTTPSVCQRTHLTRGLGRAKRLDIRVVSSQILVLALLHERTGALLGCRVHGDRDDRRHVPLLPLVAVPEPVVSSRLQEILEHLLVPGSKTQLHRRAAFAKTLDVARLRTVISLDRRVKSRS